MENIQQKRSYVYHGHGSKNRPTEYVIWTGLKYRCNNPNDKSYYKYGGRGIRVCDRWLYSFENFLHDMGERPSKRHSIDRIDNNGDYSPENCRWATLEEQANNKRDTLWFTNGKGVTKCLADWAKESIVNYNVLKGRLTISKWSVEDAISTPLLKCKGVNKEKIRKKLINT